MSKIRSSPSYGKFERLLEKSSPMDDLTLFAASLHIAELEEREENPANKKDNLEYDLRTSNYIAEKCKSKVYAQNLYAALCNTEFIRNDVWPILQEKTWSCSWRYAGGIIADIREDGDYIDWYCSGIAFSTDDTNNPGIAGYVGYVEEGIVTDEVREDLLKLGWIVLDDKY